ncbi:MAG TPA: hypothetical protein VNU47_02845 [Candidatus Paceibacterota bacterium]|nr:hypothetical protein [Candidatus Paceibacterota bacterium]
MKHMTIGVFSDRSNAEAAINRVHNELNVPNDDISYVYRNSEGDVTEVDAKDITTDTPAEGAGKGAMVGGAIGAIAGLATVAGVIPVIGPLFAAGPLAAALGLTGAIGTTAAGAATGAAAGGVIGALSNMGVGQEKAQHYADRVGAGDILVAVHSEKNAEEILRDCGAVETGVYALAV